MANPIIWKKWQYKIDGRYIVVYQARANDNVYRIAKKLSKELDAKYIQLISIQIVSKKA